MLWGYDTYATGPGVLALRPIARRSRFFMPSAAPGRVWIAFLDATQPVRARRLGAVREVTAAGGVTVPDARPPAGSAPRRPADAGLLFFVHHCFGLWGLRRRVVVRTFPADRIGYPGPSPATCSPRAPGAAARCA